MDSSLGPLARRDTDKSRGQYLHHACRADWRGFRSVYIYRMNPKAVLRFVTADGRELDRWDESAPPDKVKSEVPPGDHRVEWGIIRK